MGEVCECVCVWVEEVRGEMEEVMGVGVRGSRDQTRVQGQYIRRMYDVQLFVRLTYGIPLFDIT